MPSEAPLLATQTEKPHHYTYLKEFRTQQCPLFLQHKCTQHRPFTCFHWHFMNQRRRRPVRRRDGTFNYNPDVYCTKYDETTGLCPDGDECPYLHRTAGDTERRYHLRYYKTCTCVHETDARGHCVKNGPHCAFAHGAHDLRPPVYDVREVQSGNEGSGDQAGCGMGMGMMGMGESPLGSSLEKDRIINEDPRWNDTNYVLANYKTEPCKRPPRLCRQGYACPSYHNSRDKRRSPKTHKYRSTPCPHVKHGDDWGDPSQCDNGDNCPYCHTRTEQQFHPEIYKSTKCNDMVQTGYCPRGPFCAFAHVEMEMTTQRDMGTPTDNSLAAFFPNALLPSSTGSSGGNHKLELGNGSDRRADEKTNGNSLQLLMNTNQQSHNPVTTTMGDVPTSSPGPIGRGRTSSLTGSLTNSLTSSLGLMDPNCHSYQKAPGSEREDGSSKLRLQIQALDNDVNLDPVERSKRKQNLLLLHNLNIGSPLGAAYLATLESNPTTPSSTVSSLMSPHAQSFYPPGDTVESVIAFKSMLGSTATTTCDTCASGNALDEDLNLGDLNLSTIDREFSRDNDDTNSVCSSLSAGFTSSSGGAYLGATSVPVTIPSGGYQRGRVSSISQSPPSASPLGNLTAPGFFPVTDTNLQQQQKQEQQLQEAAAAFLSQPNPGKYSAPGFSTDFNSMSPSSNPGLPASPLIGPATYSAGGMNGYELQRVRDELVANKLKLSQWEDGITQARSACDAWKREAEESSRKAKKAEEEKLQAITQRDEALAQLAKLRQETERLQDGGFSVMPSNVVPTLESVPHLKQVQTQLSSEIDPSDHATNSANMAHLAQMLCQSAAMKCMVCREKNRSVAVSPCNHYVLCDSCAAKATDCPYCHVHISQRSNIVLPL